MSSGVRTTAALTIMLALWGTAPPAIRATLHFYSPFHVALMRFLVASVTLGVYAAVTRMGLPERRDVPHLAVVALFGVFLYHTAFNYGLAATSAGPASMLINVAPIFTTLLAARFLSEPVPAAGWVGLAMSLGGAACIGFGEGKGIHFSVQSLSLLGGALFWALNIVTQKPLLERYSAVQVTAWSIWIGTLMLLLYAPGLAADLRGKPPAALIGVVFLGIFPIGVAYVAWAYALANLPAGRAASFLYLVPLIATLTAWVGLHETPPRLSLLGGLLALGGVAIVNAGRRLSARREAEVSLPPAE